MKSAVTKLLSGSLWSMMAKLGAIGFGFLITIILARFLDQSQLGEFYLFQSSLLAAAIIAKLGLDVGIQKILGASLAENNERNIKQYIYTGYCLSIGSSCIVAAIIFFAWPWLAITLFESPFLASIGFILALAVMLRVFEEFNSAIFRGLQIPEIGVMIFDMPRLVIFFSLLFLLSLSSSELTVDEAVEVLLLASGSSVLIGTFLLRKKLKKQEYQSEISCIDIKSSAGGMLKLSTPMMWHAGVAILMSSADIWVLGSFSDKVTVGIYSTMTKLAVIMVLSLSIVNMVLPSMIAGLYQQRKLDEVEYLVRTSAWWSLLIAIPLLLVFYLYGKSLIVTFFGPEFIAGNSVLMILASAYAFNAISGSSGVLLQMTGNERVLLKITMFWAVANIVMSIFAVANWGVNGVAVATAVSLVGQNLSNVLAAQKILSIKTWFKVPKKIII